MFVKIIKAAENILVAIGVATVAILSVAAIAWLLI